MSNSLIFTRTCKHHLRCIYCLVVLLHAPLMIGQFPIALRQAKKKVNHVRNIYALQSSWDYG